MIQIKKALSAFLLQTHTLTHNRKFPCGTGGAKSATDLLILEQKWPKTHIRQGVDGHSHICNQQVGGSNPSTSSTLLS